MNVIKVGKDLYEQRTCGPWEALYPVKAPEVKDARIRWTGGKIPLSLADQALAFLAWSFEHTKSEAMIYALYHEESRRWTFAVPPQKGYDGMTVNIIGGTQTKAEMQKQLGGEIAASWHHHCDIPAFQSGGDAKDEKVFPGLHLTTGDLGKGRYSLHARASFQQVMTDVHLSDWFELPTAFDGFPEHIRDAAVEHLLCTPSAVAFPEEWKANVIKVEPPKQEFVWNGDWDRRTGKKDDCVWDTGWRKDRKKASWDGNLRSELNSFMFLRDMDPKQTVEWLKHISVEYDGIIPDLMTLLDDCDSDIWDAIRALEESPLATDLD